MEGGEFLRRAGDLRDLVQHPGFAFLEELLAVEVAGIRARAKAEDPLLLARRIAEDPAMAAVKLASSGGEARGLERFGVFVQRMLQLAQRVKDQKANEEEAP